MSPEALAVLTGRSLILARTLARAEATFINNPTPAAREALEAAVALWIGSAE